MISAKPLPIADVVNGLASHAELPTKGRLVFTSRHPVTNRLDLNIGHGGLPSPILPSLFCVGDPLPTGSRRVSGAGAII